MVTMSAFALVVTSEAANSLSQWSKDTKFSQVPMDTWQPPTVENQMNGFSGGKATA